MKRKVFYLSCLLVFIMLFFAGKEVFASSIDNCVINDDHGSIRVEATVDSVKNDDDKIYLFAQNVYEEGLSNPVQIVGYGTGKFVFYVPFEDGTLLYRRYILAVKQNGSYVPITDYKYITNPETMAVYNAPKMQATTKKGTSASIAGLLDLNCDNGFLDISYDELISGVIEENNSLDEQSIYYNGFTYVINGARLLELDNTIKTMTDNNIVVTASLNSAYAKKRLNRPRPSSYAEVLHSPNAGSGGGIINYGFNTETDEGQNMIVALTLFLANRYSNPDTYGVISNYLIGNEINDEYTYYNIGATSLSDFTEKYMKTFRVMYNAIRSTNSTSDVYMSLSNLWYINEEFVRNTSQNQTDAFPCKLFIDKFNNLAKKQGNFNWGVAFHPYSYPLDEASVYDDDEFTYLDHNNQKQHYVSNSENTFEITMKNIEVLTNYMNKPEFKDTNSNVRSIILTEQGYMSTTKNVKDELMQSASIAYAYYKAESLKDIDQFILFKFQDTQELSNEPYGLRNIDGTKKYSYNVYKNINSSNSLENTNFALKIFGISSWNNILSSPTGSGTFTDYITSKMPDRKSGNFIKVDSLPSHTLLLGYNYMDSDWEKICNILSTDQIYTTKGKTSSYKSQDNINLDNGEDRNNNYWAITQRYGYAGEFKIITKKFSSPLDLSNEPYFGFVFEIDKDVDYYSTYPANIAPTQADLVVRLYSESGDIYEASTKVDLGQTFFSKPYNLYMDLSSWNGKNSISRMEVGVLEIETESMVAEISVLKINKAVSVSGTTMQSIESEKTDISSGSISSIGTQNYTGNKITPEFTVIYGENTLTPDVDYIYTFANNQYSGIATLTVAGIGKYSGYLSTTFTIYAPISNNGVTVTPEDPNALNYGAVFNPEEYLKLNPDVKSALGNNYDTAFWHFLNFGMSEGREATSNFNVLKYAYCLLNDDLRKAFGGNMKDYYLHYLRFGQYEGRSKSDWDNIFDSDFYLDSNPDVKTYLIKKYTSDCNLKGWCLWHYLEFGANEGRLANSEFSVLNYASVNPDVFRAYTKYENNKIITDFKAVAVHYLQFGKGRPIVNGKYDMNNLPTLRPDVVEVLGISNLAGWVDWYINFGSKGM